MHVVLGEHPIFDIEIARFRTDIRIRGLHRLAHHIAELSSDRGASAAVHARRFDEHDLAAERRPSEAGGHADLRASLRELVFEDRFYYEPDRLLDDAVLDRGNSQWSRPAIAFRDLDPLDRLRTVRALPQRRRKLQQIGIRLRREPFHALPIHTRRAFVCLKPGQEINFTEEAK